MKISTICFLIAALLTSAGMAQADTRVAYVNTQRILADAPQAAKAKKKIEKEFEKRDQELSRLARQLKSLQETMEKNAMTMTDSDRRGKERELGELGREFQRRQREFNEDMNLRQNEEMAAIFERLNKAIKSVADAEKYDLILQDVLYASPRIDITDRVIKALSEPAAK